MKEQNVMMFLRVIENDQSKLPPMTSVVRRRLRRRAMSKLEIPGKRHREIIFSNDAGENDSTVLATIVRHPHVNVF